MIIRVPESRYYPSTHQLYERIEYPAGELQIRFLPGALPTLYGTSKISVVCRMAHQHLMELALLSEALHSLLPYAYTELILPYLPYARADRRFLAEGDCHGLRTFGDIINGMRYNAVKTLDVHSFRAQKHVANLQNQSPRPFFSKAIADITDGGGHPIVLLPDEGAVRRYCTTQSGVVALMGAHQARKKRDAATGQLSGFEVPQLPEGRDVLIVDDICDGGGTFVGLAKAIEDKYANMERLMPKLYLYVTHGIFSKGLKELLTYFEKVYTTNSLRGDDVQRFGGLYFPGKKLEVYDCEPFICD